MCFHLVLGGAVGRIVVCHLHSKQFEYPAPKEAKRADVAISGSICDAEDFASFMSALQFSRASQAVSSEWLQESTCPLLEIAHSNNICK